MSIPKPDDRKPQRTTLILDPALHKQLKLLAVERGTTLTELMTAALREYLARERKGGKRS